jgi:membrane dipeptidase
VRDWALEAERRARVDGVDPRDIPALQAVEAVYQEEVPHPPATIADVVAHLDHVRAVAGVDHVGLGGDYDGVDWLPEGLEDVASYPRLLETLRGARWSDDDLAKLTCRNVLRSLRGIETAASPRT